MNRPSLQIAYITGRSLPGLTELSQVQRMFIRQLARPGRQVVGINFPYICHFEGREPVAPPGLFTASINNSRDYLASRRSPFRNHYHKAVVGLLGQAHHTVFLAGSCGLELFNNLHLPPDIIASTSLIAYGPVARKRPLCRHILIQGNRDWLSRVWFRHVDYSVPCGHMTYLSRPEMLAICQHFIAKIESQEVRS